MIESQGGVSAEKAASWKWKGGITIETVNQKKKREGKSQNSFIYLVTYRNKRLLY